MEGNIIEHIINFSEELITRIESNFEIPTGYLRTQLALHLPQFEISDILRDGIINKSLIISECLRLGSRLEYKFFELPKEFRELVLRKDQDSKIIHKNNEITEIEPAGTIQKLKFSCVPPEIGMMIQTTLHYIGNARPDTLYHFGLFHEDENYPFAYLSFSLLDRSYIHNSLPFESEKEEILVLTRAYNVNCSPFNAMSLLISKSSEEVLNNNRNIKALITAINPNTLFRGTLFKASAFYPFASVPFVPRYRCGNYITRKGLANLTPEQINREIIDNSKFPLLPTIWTIKALDKKILKYLKDYPIKKVNYEMYNQG